MNEEKGVITFLIKCHQLGVAKQASPPPPPLAWPAKLLRARIPDPSRPA